MYSIDPWLYSNNVQCIEGCCSACHSSSYVNLKELLSKPIDPPE